MAFLAGDYCFVCLLSFLMRPPWPWGKTHVSRPPWPWDKTHVSRPPWPWGKTHVSRAENPGIATPAVTVGIIPVR